MDTYGAESRTPALMPQLGISCKAALLLKHKLMEGVFAQRQAGPLARRVATLFV
jgi:hypothetical protein